LQPIPPKLLKYIATLPEAVKKEKIDLFNNILAQATRLNLQSARFWAMRQVVSGKKIAEIERKLKKRRPKNP
jgi:hypothetical protein